MGHSIEARNLKMMGGVTAVGGMITIYAAILGGPVLGLAATIVIGLVQLTIAAYFITLVAQSVQTWINRSIFSANEIQVNKFEDIIAEQNSLEMVFSGVVVDYYWQKHKVYSVQNQYDFLYPVYGEAEYSYSYQYVIYVSISVPRISDFKLKVSMISLDLGDSIFSWEYEKTQKDSQVKSVVSSRRRSSHETGSQPELEASDYGYTLNWSQAINESSLGSVISLDVHYTDSLNSKIRSDNFINEVEYE